MKRFILAFLISGHSTVALLAQGTVAISNDPVYDAAEFGGGLLAGTNFFAQLFAAAGSGVSSDSLVAVGVPMNFQTGVAAGYVKTNGVNSLGQPVSTQLAIPVPSGGPATLQLRAWWSGGTLITSYGEALASANLDSRAGASPVINLVSSGTPQVPMPVEFQSFALAVVHPLALAIAGHGEGALLSWPTNYTGFSLETTDDPAASNRWSVCPGSPSMVGNRFIATNAFTNAQQFFRLKK